MERHFEVATLRARHAAGISVRALALECKVNWGTMRRLLGPALPNAPRRWRRESPMPPPSPAFAIWAAGFFDGEGTVYISPRGQLISALNQVVEAPVRDLAAAFGGTVVVRPPRGLQRQQWAWRTSGGQTVNFLRVIRPHLRVKAAVVDAALRLMGVMDSYEGRRRLPDAEIAKRLAAHDEISQLNRRGRAAA